jgi:hypothetical protein
MAGSENQSESTWVEEQCGHCQHSVDVRGMEQIVCLAHLEIRHPTKDNGCSEFERKRKKPGATTRD